MSLAEFYSSRMVGGSGNPNLKFRQVAAEGGLDGAHSDCSPHNQSFALVYVRIKGRGGLAYGSSSWFVLFRRGTRRHFKVTNTQHKIQFHSGHVCLLCSNPFASSPIIMLLYIIIPVVFYTYTFEGLYWNPLQFPNYRALSPNSYSSVIRKVKSGPSNQVIRIHEGTHILLIRQWHSNSKICWRNSSRAGLRRLRLTGTTCLDAFTYSYWGARITRIRGNGRIIKLL